MLNSCLGHFSAATSRWHPFSRTYGVNLPSSLTTLLPLVLGFSPHPPVSVCGTGTCQLDSGFSRQCGIPGFGTCFSLPITPSRCQTILTPDRHCAWTDHSSCPPGYPPVSPLLSCANRQYRNVNLFSIDYASRPRLRSRLTLGGRPFPRKPWMFDGKDSHFALVTYSDILTPDMSPDPLGSGSATYRTLPYQPLRIP